MNSSAAFVCKYFCSLFGLISELNQFMSLILMFLDFCCYIELKKIVKLKEWR